VTVTARLSDDAAVTEEKVGSTGTFVFENLPFRTIIFEAVAANGSSGASGLIGGGASTIFLFGFNEASDIDNNDFSQGTDGWIIENASSASIQPHNEDVGPEDEDSGGRGRRLEDALSDQDLVIETVPVEGPTYCSRTFETKEGTTGVRIRYRFETSEYPTYFNTEFNDFFKVSIRSQVAGGSKTEANSMNGLGAAAFGPGSVYPSTSWRELVLPVSADGDTIQVDVTVANVGDGAVQSYVYVDFVEELKQSLCIYSKAFPDDALTAGHAAIVFHSKGEEADIFQTYGLWPDSYSTSINNGEGSDIRVNFEKDNPLLEPCYKWFYCEPISDEKKKILDELVAKNVEWTCTNQCATFASETFYDVTGTDVDADDFLGLETPREISESIVALNGGSPLPPEGLPWGGAGGSGQCFPSANDSSFSSSFLTSCNFI